MTDLAKVLGPLEAEIMRVLWAADGALTVRQVLGALNSGREPTLAYTTVMTVMSRLADKGILSREPLGRGFAYQAALPDAAAIAVRNVLRDFGDAAIARFVDQVDADPSARERLRRLLEVES
ncbi:BlaI/MecI/CopY family transcriptional regulator [Nonomuraea soli]|uniref:Putative transcriptional regulator n=1 Tax=Nonomuraea soli TaxID=1032476 RepID=A0A7W0CID8_9ACTN|nr:BlaI/MecI/CopY family transcriptional regulator [Nonomuraea soli]MBA2891741.1 putative transcriptional regulator [Nonomuraea soli]